MENRCICCGAEVPEGRMVCINCERNSGGVRQKKKTDTKKKTDNNEDRSAPKGLKRIFGKKK